MPTTQVCSQAIFYDDQGSGHPLLLLAGLGGNRLSWWKQIEAFAAKYRIINMDNRDAGDSALATGPYTIADMADDAAAVIQNYDLGPAHLIGHSLGGCIALELAIRYPSLVEKVILVSTHTGGKSMIQPNPEIFEFLIPKPGEDIETITRRSQTAFAGKGYVAGHPEDLDQIVKNAIDKPIKFKAYQRQANAGLEYDAKDRLDKISVPALVIHGDEDPLVPFANGKYLAKHIKGARLATFTGVGIYHTSKLQSDSTGK